MPAVTYPNLGESLPEEFLKPMCRAMTCDLLHRRLMSGKWRVDDLHIQFPPSLQEGA